MKKLILAITLVSLLLLPNRARADNGLTVTKSVGINVPQTQSSVGIKMAQAANLYLEIPTRNESFEYSHQNLKAIFDFLQQPVLHYLVLGFIVLAYVLFGITLIAFKKHKQKPWSAFLHWLSFFIHHPSVVFLRLAPVEVDNRWSVPFNRYKKYHRTAQFLMIGSLAILLIKITLTAGIAMYLLSETRAQIENAQLADEGKNVHPGDTLTYRITWINTIDQPIQEWSLTDPLPQGTKLEENSFQAQNSSAESEIQLEYNSGDNAVHATWKDISPQESGFVEFKVQINMPNELPNITNQATFKVANVDFNTNKINNPLQTGSIGDTLWLDNNQNREQDPDEPGIQNAELRLYSDITDPNNLNRDADRMLLETKSNDLGKYDFTGLGSGIYWIEIKPDSLPDQAKFTFNTNPKKISLAFSEWISLEKTADYNGADFGIFVQPKQNESSETQEIAEPTDTTQKPETDNEPQEQQPQSAPEETPTQKNENNKKNATPINQSAASSEKTTKTTNPTTQAEVNKNQTEQKIALNNTSTPERNPFDENFQNLTNHYQLLATAQGSEISKEIAPNAEKQLAYEKNFNPNTGGKEFGQETKQITWSYWMFVSILTIIAAAALTLHLWPQSQTKKTRRKKLHSKKK